MSGGRILIVEDEAIVAMFIGDLLDVLGYEVEASVTNGPDAVRLALDTDPDLVLMDINLAGSMDGIEAARIIREQKNIPVVFVTAYSDEATRKRAEAIGPAGYLLKPFKQEELNLIIDSALSS